jgi:hypothetical protein
VTTRYIRRRLQVATAIMLSIEWGVAWATLNTVWPKLTEWPWLQVAVGCLVAMAGGWTTFLMRYNAAKYDERPFAFAREFSINTIFAVVAGMAAYFLAASIMTEPGHEAWVGLILLGAGVAGEPFLRRLGEWVVSLMHIRSGE